MTTPVFIFCDGSYLPERGIGGWAAVIYWRGHRWEIGGASRSSSSRHMEFKAIEVALRAVPDGHPAYVFTDEQSLTIKHRKRFAAKNVHLVWKQARCADHEICDRLSKAYSADMAAELAGAA